jgi:hypothetical protein
MNSNRDQTEINLISNLNTEFAAVMAVCDTYIFACVSGEHL